MESSIGKRIAEQRRRLRLTQEELAEKLDVTPQAVSKWENDISCPDVLMLPRLADLFEMSVDTLLRGKQEVATRLIPEEERRDYDKMLLRIIVNAQDGTKVRVNLPVSLIKIALDIGAQIPQVNGNEALKNVDFRAIIDAVDHGVVGKLVEVDSPGGDQVEIYVE